MGDKRRRRLGDRRDGRRIRTLDPLNELVPFIMKVKSGASNHYSHSIEIAGIEAYLRDKRQQGHPGIGLLHLIVAAYIRVVSQYPGINRFISGQRIFARNNIEVVMMVKKEMTMDASETSIKVTFDVRDTVIDVFNKLNAEIESVKGEGDTTDADDTAKALMKMPRLILKFAIFILAKMDYFGMVPKALVKVSPFHGSIILTDLGSIGLPAIYHHLYDFGNIPVFIALGVKRRVHELKPDGTVEQKKYLDFKLVVDERICDGFYFSQAIKLFKSILRHPEKLDEPPEKVVEDIE